MKKILICIDVQNDFITGSLANEEAQKKIPNIIKKIKNFDGDYIFMTRDTHNDNYLETKEGESLPVVHCVKNTWGWEIEDSVATAFTERINDDSKVVGCIIDKPTFGSLELAEQILNIEKGTKEPVPMEIEIIGFVSSICVVSNALLLKAFTYDFADIYVDNSCTAGLSYENNNAALEILKSCQIHILDSSD